MTNEDLRYPLHYPIGWQRTKFPQRSRFNPNRDRTFAECRDELLRQLSLLGASKVILSTNIPLRSDGLPYARFKIPDDKGVAAYFQLNNQDMALACDAWDRVEDNIWAIAKHIDALRGQQRWSVGTIEQAFRGYQAYLPAPKEHRHGEGWWTALHISSTATPQEVEAAYRKLAAYYHPDSPTGNEQMMVIINQAISEARKEFKSN